MWLKSWYSIAEHCLKVNAEERAYILKDLAHELKVDVPNEPVEDYKALSWTEILQLRKEKIEIGSHTCTHARLALLTAEKIRFELEASKARIESVIDEAVSSLCYPYGREEDINEEVVKITRESGYKTAVTAYTSFGERINPYKLGRYPVGEDYWDFKSKIYGVNRIMGVFRHIIRKKAHA